MEYEYSFTFKLIDDGFAQCTCNEWPMIGLKWPLHHFNDQQQPTTPFPILIPNGMGENEPQKIMREMGDWLNEHYHNIVF